MWRANGAKVLIFLMLFYVWSPYVHPQGLGDLPIKPKELPKVEAPQGNSSEGQPAEQAGQGVQGQRQHGHEGPSRIEMEFKERFGGYLGEDLRQFGYDFFVQSRRVMAQVGDDYVLGPGDKVKFYLAGDPVEMGILQSEYRAEVAPDGRLYVPGVGMVSASGISLRALKEAVSGELLKRYKGVIVEVVLESLRTFNVYVSGFVRNPGMYAVNTLDTVVSALALAGGVDKKESLRKITVRQRTNAGWTEREIDLYEMFMHGKPVDVFLKDGDVIHVGPIGPVVGIGGDVKRPGIYELKGEANIKDVLELAGGLYPFAYPELVRIFRYEDDRLKAIQVSLIARGVEDTEVRDGDLILVAGVTQDIKELVFVEGDVDYPGPYSLKEVRSLSELLERAKPRVTADLRIGRIIKKDKTTVNFVPEEVLSGQKDVLLEDGDRVYVPSKFSREPVYVWGEVKEARTIPYYEGLRLMDALRDLEFRYDIRELKAVISTKAVVEAEVYLYDLFVLSESKANIELKPGSRVFIQRTYRTEKVPTITILGQVFRPGKYELREGMTLADALKLSGGLTEGAYLKGLILIRQSARKAQQASLDLAFAALEESLMRHQEGLVIWEEEEKKMAEAGVARARQYLSLLRKRTERNLGRIALELPETLEELERSKANILLEDGDEILVPSRPGYILVLGDVYNPVALPYQRGMAVKDYLEMVGGPTRGADTKDIYVIKANGRVISQRTYGKPFFLGASLMGYKLEEGDAIVVPTKVKVPVLWRPLIRDVVQIIFQSIATAVLAKRL